MNITEQELAQLKASRFESEWNNICDKIKRVRGGKYPPDWFAKMMLSGLAGDAQKNWIS